MRFFRVFLLFILLLQLLQAFGEASSASSLKNTYEGTQSFALRKHPPLHKINCNYECSRRCSKAFKRKRCKRACKTCCHRCHCVPPGTYGNKEACPCYAGLKTHGNRPKCP